MADGFEIPDEVTVVYLFLLPFAIDKLEGALERARRRGARVLTYQSHLPGEATSEAIYGMVRLFEALPDACRPSAPPVPTSATLGNRSQ